MIDINLLPWRFYAYKRQQRMLNYIFFGSMFIAVIFLLFLHYFLQTKIGKEKIKINELQHQLSSLVIQSNEALKLQKQMKNFNNAVQLFEKIAINQVILLDFTDKILQITPQDIRFLEIKSEDNKVVLKGTSQSSSALSSLVSGFTGQYFQAAQFLEIKNDVVLKKLSFQFQVTQNSESLFDKDKFHDLSK